MTDGTKAPPPPAYETTLILETKGPGGASRLIITELLSLGEMERMLSDLRQSRPHPTIYAVLDINSGFKRFPMLSTGGSMVRSMGDYIYVRVDDELTPDIRMAKGAAIMVVHDNIDGSMSSQTFTHLGDGFFGLTTYK